MAENRNDRTPFFGVTCACSCLPCVFPLGCHSRLLLLVKCGVCVVFDVLKRNCHLLFDFENLSVCGGLVGVLLVDVLLAADKTQFVLLLQRLNLIAKLFVDVVNLRLVHRLDFGACRIGGL